jgi:hypothetical protein
MGFVGHPHGSDVCSFCQETEQHLPLTIHSIGVDETLITRLEKWDISAFTERHTWATTELLLVLHQVLAPWCTGGHPASSMLRAK